MSDRLRDRPWIIGLLIALAAQLLFSIHLDRPSRLTFDETHYVPAARALLALAQPVNTEHPLLGKTLIAAGMAVFGDNPVGWRAAATLAGTATVAGGFAILMLLFGSVRTASLGALAVALNQTVFVQARIGMLDGFLGAFAVLAIAAMLWSATAPPTRVWPRLLLAGALAGAAVAVKWAAIPYVALGCLSVFLVRWRDGRGLLSGSGQPHWPGVRSVDAAIGFGGIAVAVYFATFLPAFFYGFDPLTLDRLIPFQFAMLDRQTQVLAPHGYQSDWWSWPLMLRPVWYFYEPDRGAVRGVLLLGNPVVMWGGLIAIIACARAAWRGAAALGLLAGLWAFSVLIFAVIPKSLGFYYYYHLSGVLIALALAAAVARARRRWPRADWMVAAAIVAMFAGFYPIIAAAPLPNDQAFNVWMWLDSWR